MPTNPNILTRIFFFGDLILPLNFYKRFIFFGSTIFGIILYLSGGMNLAGKLALAILSLVIFTKPLVKLFPTIGFFKTLLALRRQTGQASAIFAISHVFSMITDFGYYLSLGPTAFQFWGVLALYLMLILFVTSNDFSTRVLKRNWFLLQKLIHPMYVFVLLHYGIQKGPVVFFLCGVTVVVLYLSRFLAAKNVQLLTNLKPASI